jgi:hypothetical protein
MVRGAGLRRRSCSCPALVARCRPDASGIRLRPMIANGWALSTVGLVALFGMVHCASRPRALNDVPDFARGVAVVVGSVATRPPASG